MPSLRPNETILAFSRFTLSQEPPRLVADGLEVELGARALELLIALVEARGRPVAQAELGRRGWPELNVDVNTVQSQISALRRALGDDRDLIVTVPGFGYRFAAEVQTNSAGDYVPPASPTPPAPPAPSWQLPSEPPIVTAPLAAQPAFGAAASPARTQQQLTPFIGRHAELSEVLGLISITRLITLVGATGAGKARLAHEAARRLAARFRDGVVPVALSALTPDDGFAAAFALALHLPAGSGQTPLARLLDGVRTRDVLLVVDCNECDGALAAHTLDALLAAGPNVRAIVTASAPLGLCIEEVVTLGPLRTPEQPRVNATLAPEYDALRLLFARLATLSARRERQRVSPQTSQQTSQQTSPRPLSGNALLTALDGGAMSQAAIDAAVLITQLLAGVPLALELAAATIDQNMRAGEPLESALARYAQCLDALIGPRIETPGVPHSRSAPITLAFDLHFARLDRRARLHLLRLSMFAGEFPRCAAIGLLGACEPPMAASTGVGTPEQTHERTPATLHDAIRSDALADAALDALTEAGLVEEIDSSGQWMLHIRRPVRHLARDMLRDAGEYDRTALALATGLPVRLNAHRKRGERAHIDALDISDLEDLRASLEWSTQCERFETAISLLEGSAWLWTRLSLEPEYLQRSRAVLAGVQAGATPRRRDEMRVHAVLASTLPLAHAPVAQAIAAWETVYELANACADSAFRERALTGLIVCCSEAGDTRRAAELQARYDRIVKAGNARSGAASR
ncbi:DNA-binding winged helix-turn-helix (wHTH) protein [Paraburkholderia sp. GV068]|uniref:winged helix-turn-helix domain-containing protein n=1 Tax=unclassified Paraburkholderia TaxID=2615204 RepID=UPI000D317C3B|nr:MULTISPECIES: winged helix-turn-helix domain-containing protein [unclassified Paraburkholderia]PTQ95225.1 DNA-binding winged helix-turn-helix (wHTH) protein [Paraburkholderia sp. GV072]PUB01879.1 DNA-binding winged helix-turn-helix (wHTH) protein [Paraburkholderia sp. GV068]